MELGFGIVFDPEFANAAMSISFNTPTPVIPGLPTNSNKDGTTGNLSGDLDHVVIEVEHRILYTGFSRGVYFLPIQKGSLAIIKSVSWLSESSDGREVIVVGASNSDFLIHDDTGVTLFTQSVEPSLHGTKMHIQITWTLPAPAEERTFHSPVFKLEGGNRQPADDVDERAFKADLTPDQLNGFDGDRITGDTAGVGSSGTTTTSPGTTSTNSTSSGNSALPSSEASGSGGLSKGAIAGIAVGCGLVFLIALGLLAFFLWRRRRREADHVKSAAYDGRMGTHDYMNDKETQGRVAESPHSPYSDDGLRRDSALLHDVQDPHTSQDRSFAPYSDAAPAQSSSPTTQAARDAAPQQGAPTAMAHLVEDGMTQDDIRRLEEEERALDRAIEQAGHR